MKKFFAFTLAETLITLSIIGIIAAITLPTIITSYKKQTTVTKLKKSYTDISLVMLRAFSESSSSDISVGSLVNENTVKEFFDTYWLPYFNSPQIIESDGFLYKRRDGENAKINVATLYNYGRIYFLTQDGVSYFVNIMNWEGTPEGDLGNAIFAAKQVVIVDINGNKTPNIIGKDVFLFDIDFTNGTVRPDCYNYNSQNINKNCSMSGSGYCCAAKIMHDGWKITKDYPW